MGEPSIAQMNGHELDTFVRNKGGYVHLLPNQLAQINQRRREIKCATMAERWSINDAVNFLKERKKPSLISPAEWDALSKVMGLEKKDIIDSFFSLFDMQNPTPIESIAQGAVRIGTQANPEYLPSIAEINSWNSQQAAEFLCAWNKALKLTDEHWSALQKAAGKDADLFLSKAAVPVSNKPFSDPKKNNDFRSGHLRIRTLILAHKRKIIASLIAGWAIAEAYVIYKNRTEKERKENKWYNLPARTAQVMISRPINGVNCLMRAIKKISA